MSEVDGVVAAIDAALEDCTVGPDAMRWAPDEQPAALNAWRGHGNLLILQDESHVWTREQMTEWQRCVNGMLERRDFAMTHAAWPPPLQEVPGE